MKRAHPISLVVLSLGAWLAGQARTYSAPPPCVGERCAVAAANRCAAGKVEASGTYMQDVLACSALSGFWETAGRECRRRAERKLVATFAVLERPGACKTTGDADETADRIDRHVVELVAMLGTRRAPLCTALQLAAMGADADRQHGCYAEAVVKGAGFSVDPKCQSTATQRFLWDLAPPGPLCATGHADGPAIDASIRAAASGNRSAIAMPVTKCAPVEVTTLHGDGFAGNVRLARIERGRVGCLSVNDGSLASCVFSTAHGSESGAWLEGPTGAYARVGQAISQSGIPGGDYIVAAKVSDAEPAPCVESVGLDTMGWTPDGSELAPNSCVVEEMGQPWNTVSRVGFSTLVNFADLEVCTSTQVHPDGAVLVRSYPQSGSGPDDTFCYTGRGAALNDVNGIERDENGQYYSGEQYCHYLQNAGYEAPAAKRPATRSLPAPGSINTRSPIAWRPVNPNFSLANGVLPVERFTDKASFIEATGATSASGPLPDIGRVAGAATVGTVTFSLAPGGNSLAIGASGTGAAPDWYPAMAGNEIAMGYENLQVQTAAPVYSMGFDFVEPNATMPAYGGTPVDSTFEVVLYMDNTEVGRSSFNAPDDQVTFFGVWSRTAFNRVTIIDMTGDGDDEFFGQFYTGTVKK
jgi:hypothetical protein